MKRKVVFVLFKELGEVGIYEKVYNENGCLIEGIKLGFVSEGLLPAIYDKVIT